MSNTVASNTTHWSLGTIVVFPQSALSSLRPHRYLPSLEVVVRRHHAGHQVLLIVFIDVENGLAVLRLL